jgi:tRNA/tmRNA/rRNA uracil-C5-methylase (TrmA/RlmC/RlmD family)/tRNA(Ser,Leu) C12 N-acetylase TAN1
MSLPRERELEEKRRRLEKLLGGFPVLVRAGSPVGARSRMDFVFHPGGLGLRRPGSWRDVEDVTFSPLAEPRINELLAEVREAFRGADAFDPRRRAGTYRYAVLRGTREESSVSIVLNPESPGRDAALERIRDWAPRASAAHVLVTFVPPRRDASVSEDYMVLKGRDRLRERLLDRTFEFPVQGFFQNNRAMAEEMLRHARAIWEGRSGREAALLDLYAGVGTFGIVAADLFREVVLVEAYGPAVESAERNAASNGARNVRAVRADVAEELERLELPGPLHVVADPPRGGLSPRVLAALRRLAPETIVYVSCNPGRMREELPALEGYELAGAVLFDLFPGTPHVEAVVELRRAGTAAPPLPEAAAPEGAGADWNVVVSVREGRFQEACRLLASVARPARTGFFNLLALRVEDPVRFLEDLERLAAGRPEAAGILSRVSPAREAFSFASAAEYRDRSARIAEAWAPRLADRAFYVRVRRRGLRARLSSLEEERRLAGVVLDALARAGRSARVRFDDPDAVLVVEILGTRAGMALWTREELARWPWIRPE